MMHVRQYEEVLSRDLERGQLIPKSEAVHIAKSLEDAAEPAQGTSAEAETAKVKVKENTYFTSWFQSRSWSELRKIQKDDSDNSPLLAAMTADRKPSTQAMTVRSPASRRY